MSDKKADKKKDKPGKVEKKVQVRDLASKKSGDVKGGGVGVPHDG